MLLKKGAKSGRASTARPSASTSSASSASSSSSSYRERAPKRKQDQSASGSERLRDASKDSIEDELLKLKKSMGLR